MHSTSRRQSLKAETGSPNWDTLSTPSDLSHLSISIRASCKFQCLNQSLPLVLFVVLDTECFRHAVLIRFQKIEQLYKIKELSKTDGAFLAVSDIQQLLLKPCLNDRRLREAFSLHSLPCVKVVQKRPSKL